MTFSVPKRHLNKVSNCLCLRRLSPPSSTRDSDYAEGWPHQAMFEQEWMRVCPCGHVLVSNAKKNQWFDNIHVDLIAPQPPSNGHTYLIFKVLNFIKTYLCRGHWTKGSDCLRRPLHVLTGSYLSNQHYRIYCGWSWYYRMGHRVGLSFRHEFKLWAALWDKRFQKPHMSSWKQPNTHHTTHLEDNKVTLLKITIWTHQKTRWTEQLSKLNNFQIWTTFKSTLWSSVRIKRYEPLISGAGIWHKPTSHWPVSTSNTLSTIDIGGYEARVRNAIQVPQQVKQ